LNVKPGGTQKKKKKSWVLKGYGTILKWNANIYSVFQMLVTSFGLNNNDCERDRMILTSYII
jgi:hypothetical protein